MLLEAYAFQGRGELAPKMLLWAEKAKRLPGCIAGFNRRGRFESFFLCGSRSIRRSLLALLG